MQVVCICNLFIASVNELSLTFHLPFRSRFEFWETVYEQVEEESIRKRNVSERQAQFKKKKSLYIGRITTFIETICDQEIPDERLVWLFA